MEVATGDIVEILSIICPPSQLTGLPSEITSLPLRQRHHFVGIDSVNDPLEYLTWPTNHTNDRQQAIHFLESFSPQACFPKQNHLLCLAYAQLDASTVIRYSADPESLFAYILVQNVLCLVLLWEDRWKYHNITLMPLPDKTHSSPHEALAALDYAQDDGSYWDAYDHDSDEQSTEPEVASEQSEDAYWAQYSSVHGKYLWLSGKSLTFTGSADSVQPSSPLPIQAKTVDFSTQVVVSIPQAILQPASKSSNERLSPYDLADRLVAVSSVEDADTLLAESDSPTDVGVPYWNGFGAPPVKHSSSIDVALSDSIRGIYRLWLASRQFPTSSKDTVGEFLTAVQHIVTSVPDEV